MKMGEGNIAEILIMMLTCSEMRMFKYNPPIRLIFVTNGNHTYVGGMFSSPIVLKTPKEYRTDVHETLN